MSAPEYPNLARRLAIITYDSLIIISMIIAWGFAINGIKFAITGSLEVEHKPTEFLIFFGMIFVPFMYHYLFWRHNKPTVAMKTWKVRLNNLRSNQPPSNTQCLIRFFGGWLSFSALLLGFLVLLTSRKHAWHDAWSQTELLIQND